MKISMQIITVSTLNRREHFRLTAARKALQRSQVRRYLEALPSPSTPCIVLLTRFSAGTLDAHDNLPSAFKHVVDEIADWIGVDDGSGLVQWRYAQEKCPKGKTWITMEVAQ